MKGSDRGVSFAWTDWGRPGQTLDIWLQHFLNTEHSRYTNLLSNFIDISAVLVSMPHLIEQYPAYSPTSKKPLLTFSVIYFLLVISRPTCNLLLKTFKRLKLKSLLHHCCIHTTRFNQQWSSSASKIADDAIKRNYHRTRGRTDVGISQKLNLRTEGSTAVSSAIFETPEDDQCWSKHGVWTQHWWTF
jgi:hypothetical protein